MDRLLDELRGDANWSVLRRRRERLRGRLLDSIREHLERGDPGSLAHAVKHADSHGDIRPESQAAHWLFAFDAAGIASYRALALLAAHPESLLRVRSELHDLDPLSRPLDLPFTRACLLESVRLWPTTLAILRETTTATVWHGRAARAGTLLVVVSTFFHRDRDRLAFADAFEPQAWLDGRASEAQALVPFSAGPAGCPGRNLVLFVAGALLGGIIGRHDLVPESVPLDPRSPLPRSLDHVALRVRLSPARAGSADAVGANP